ncbi:MAG: helix-turn-helix domain-containing protein [Clostridia bacterium]|nr:helix-turn-helix domain-containing protein [Clostridia bacterium]
MTDKISAEIKAKFFVDMTCYQAVDTTNKEDWWEEQTATRFRFLYKGGEYIGELVGVGEQVRAIAALLVSYFQSLEDAQAELGKNERWKSVLLGEGSARSVYRFMAKFSVKNGACFALCVSVPKLVDEAVALLNQYGENGSDAVVKMDDSTCAVVRYVAVEEDNEYHSSFEYGEFVVQALKEELGIDVVAGVGSTVRDVKEIALSYAQAANALRYAEVFSAKGKVHTYREFVLVKMLEDLSPQKMEEYRGELMDNSAEEIFEDEEMLNTAEEFLLSSLNVSETSRNLYMHRNTLLYRLDKIEKATGLNIRLFSDAVSFRVLSILYKLLKK